jgi:uroporphyrin-III C-methyltransferase / precorrin-2 dehydrogenase / sirohydrochlorin ferrochelatase
MDSLPLFHRLAGARVVVVGEGEAAAAKRRLVARAGGICCTEADRGAARLAFVALEGPAEAEAAAERLRALGLLVNVADRPDLCDFTLPSILERGVVTVAVGTGGASAGLAKQLRLRLEALLPSALGNLAAALAQGREKMRARWPDAQVRRRALDAALAEGGPLDPFDPGAAGRVEAWLADAAPPAARETVAITLCSDDPDDLTLREARWLGAADTLVLDGAIAPAILERARADAVRTADPHHPQDAGLTVILRRGDGSAPAPLGRANKN